MNCDSSKLDYRSLQSENLLHQTVLFSRALIFDIWVIEVRLKFNPISFISTLLINIEFELELPKKALKSYHDFSQTNN